MPADSPSDHRRSRKYQQTAEHLAQVAFELFAAHDYEAVTMEQIAAADGAKGTLYNHYPVKEALLPSSVARLRGFQHRSAEFAQKNRPGSN